MHFAVLRIWFSWGSAHYFKRIYTHRSAKNEEWLKNRSEALNLSCLFVSNV